MSTDALAPGLATRGRNSTSPATAVARARLEGPLLLACAVFAVLIGVVTQAAQLTPDSWLTLLSGRELAHHGLHAPDSLALLTHGRAWTDQQWLAQLFFYGLAGAGGLRLVMAVHLVLLVGSFAFALTVARWRGASALSAAWIGVLTMLVAIWGWPLRSQNLAYPLFVGVLALLVLDRDGPSRRVFLTLPILVLWANLHGSVVLGALLVVLYAGTCAVAAMRSPGRGRTWLRCAALASAAVASVLASPYATSLPHYYRTILANPDLRLVAEWRPATAYGISWLFFGLLAVAAYLVVRYRTRLRVFEVLVLFVLAAAGFQAIRNVVWFEYAALVILPVALDGARPMRTRRSRLPSALFLPLAAGFLALAVVGAFRATDRTYEARWPVAAADRVAAAVRDDPNVRIWATEREADWLVWKHPELAGRIAYDARLELLSHRQFRQIAAFASAKGAGWHAIVDPYELVVLSTSQRPRQIAALSRDGRRPTLYRDRFVTVLGSAAGS